MDRVCVCSASRLGEAQRRFLIPPSFSPRSPSVRLRVRLAVERFPPQTHTRPVVLQQKEPLIRHSAAGNYLHLFKLLFMAFV